MVAEIKKLLRKEILKKRKSLTEEEIRELSQKVCANIEKLQTFKGAKTVLLYYPFGGEVDLRPLFGKVWEDPKKVLLLPKVTADGNMLAVEYRPDVPLVKNRYGIPEPAGGRIFKPEKLDFVAVPGVAFDRRGCRLGMGKGFYDRFLPRVKGAKVGVAYDFQIVDELPCEEHDFILDAVVTPTEILKGG